MASVSRQQRRAKQREIAKGNRAVMSEEIMIQAHKFMLVSAVVATNYCEDLARMPYGLRINEYMNIYCNELDRLAEYCRNGGSSIDWANEETNGFYMPACEEARGKQQGAALNVHNIGESLGENK